MRERNEPSPPIPAIGTACGIGQGAIIGYVAHVLFEDPAFAVGVGLIAGVGAIMFLPYILSLGAVREGTLSPDVIPAFGSIHVGALGLALDTGAMIALAARFIVESTVVPLAVAVGYAAVSFLAFRYVLPNKESLADAGGQPQ